MNEVFGNRDTGYEPKEVIAPKKSKKSKGPKKQNIWIYLMIAWAIYLMITIIFRIKMFIIMAPFFGLAIFGYLLYTTYLLKNKNDN